MKYNIFKVKLTIISAVKLSSSQPTSINGGEYALAMFLMKVLLTKAFDMIQGKWHFSISKYCNNNFEHFSWNNNIIIICI